MKKFIFLLLTCLTLIGLNAMADSLYVSGYVTDSATGAGVNNHTVHIVIDSATGGYTYNNEVHTNINGYYADTIVFSGGNALSGKLRVWLYDCWQYVQDGYYAFGPGYLNYTRDFVICTNNPPPPCQAEFYPVYSPPPSLAVHFINMSVPQTGPWNWDFGDGSTSTNFDPWHTYGAPGTYSVRLSMGDSNGVCYSSIVHEVHLSDSIAGDCHPNFTWSSDSVNHPLIIQFMDLSTGGGAGWYWDFGDGTTSTLQNPQHTYPQSGEYQVCLTITGTNPPCVDTKCAVVQVGTPPPPCQADFYPVYAPPPYLSVTFINTSVPDIGPWYWDFGDGSPGSTEFEPQKGYAAPGTYNVVLIMGDSLSGCYSTVIHQIHVGDSTGGGCHANFTWSIDSLNAPNVVHFINQSIPDTAHCIWNFGDGQTSDLWNPTHTYSTYGVYHVCLTVTTSFPDCSSTECYYVHVGTPAPCQADFYGIYFQDPLYTVHFMNTSIPAVGPWQWSFGDGTPGSTNFDPWHTYAAPGAYNVTLIMGDSLTGCFSHITHQIIVGDTTTVCHANFEWGADANNPLKIFFVDTSTPGPVSWEWHFGDGASSNVQDPSHIFAHNGVYTVCLTIATLNPPCVSEICKEVHVGPPPPPPCESWFTYMKNWLHVNFEGHMPMNQAATYNWSFGDGSSATGKLVQHDYASSGVYTVSLTTVRLDSSQCTYTSTQLVEVGDSNNIRQVYGQVFAGNFPLEHGVVMIFGSDTVGGGVPFFAISILDSIGVYMFPYVPLGNYLVWAVPFDSTGGYLPTFYGNVLYWEQATVINLGTPQNPYNINLVHSGNMPAGQGGINGQVNTRGMKSSKLDLINMLLTNEQGQAIGYRKVSSGGSFDFSGMAYGTYYLKPELPNVTSDLVKVVLSAANPVANVIMTFSGNNILGISEASAVESFVAYPNPVKDMLNLGVSLSSVSFVTAEVYNFTGQVVLRKSFDLSKGPNAVKLDVSQLNSGLYTLRMTSAEGIKVVQKFVKQ